MCNVVYAHLVAQLDRDGRADFDADLHAPAEGWDATEDQLWARIAEQAEPDGAAG